MYVNFGLLSKETISEHSVELTTDKNRSPLALPQSFLEEIVLSKGKNRPFRSSGMFSLVTTAIDASHPNIGTHLHILTIDEGLRSGRYRVFPTTFMIGEYFQHLMPENARLEEFMAKTKIGNPSYHQIILPSLTVPVVHFGYKDRTVAIGALSFVHED